MVMDLHGTEKTTFAMFSTIRVSAILLRSASGVEAPEEMLSAENIRWHGQSLWGT